MKLAFGMLVRYIGINDVYGLSKTDCARSNSKVKPDR